MSERERRRAETREYRQILRTDPEISADYRAGKGLIGGGAALTVPDSGDGPLRVKRNRYRETDDGYVRTHTIVERDGKVLAVIED